MLPTKLVQFATIALASALAVALTGIDSDAQQNRIGVATSHGDPTQIVRQALLPLFQGTNGAADNETRFFSPAFKKLADDYFSVGENARNFDADWLLGVQDWGALTPSFSTYVVDDRHAKVQVSFALDKKYENDGSQKQLPNVYTVVFDDQRGWTIDDIDYSDGISLRDQIAHEAWCRRTRNQEHNRVCSDGMWK